MTFVIQFFHKCKATTGITSRVICRKFSSCNLWSLKNKIILLHVNNVHEKSLGITAQLRVLLNYRHRLNFSLYSSFFVLHSHSPINCSLSPFLCSLFSVLYSLLPFSFSLFPFPFSLFPFPFFLFPFPFSLFPFFPLLPVPFSPFSTSPPCSLFLVPRSFFSILCSLFPVPFSSLSVPCSLLSVTFSLFPVL